MQGVTVFMKNFTKLEQPTGRLLFFEGQEYLFFGGTSYLGLATDKAYTDLFIEGIRNYGVNNGTSRNNNVQQGIFDEAERYAAQRFGFESALLLSSGYLATQFAVKELSKEGQILYAPACHPSLWMDVNPEVSGNFAEWALQTVDYINQAKESSFIVVSNSLDNMQPAHYDFSMFEGVSKDKKLVFLLDDSHGIGVRYENSISLSTRDFAHENMELIVVASLAKGLATDAGLILATHKRIAHFKKSNFYTGASPSSPAGLYAFTNGEQIYRRQFKKLQDHIRHFRMISKGSLTSIANFPVFTSSDSSLYTRLMSNRILVSSFPYPLPTDPLLNRIVVNAHHTFDDLRHLGQVIGIY